MARRPAWFIHTVMLAVLAAYTACSVSQAAVWHDELSLWVWAVERAPNKPRPHLQLALALMERHRLVEAQAVLDDTAWILDHRRDVPAWDRAEAETALLQNRLLLARMAGTGPRR